MLLLFWFSIFVVMYVYLGYPLLVAFLGILRPAQVVKRDQNPLVSILIAAFNEIEVIEATVRNKLQLDYPRERVEVIVVSDGSDDGTDAIVAGFADENVRLLRQEPRGGKTSALNMAVEQATGDILVFSDANSIYEKDALRKLVANFADPQVGYVTGRMIYVNPDGSMVGDGCSSYMRYENFLREAETRFGSVVGVDGGIDAMRKALYQPMQTDQLPDFILPLRVICQGYRVVYEPDACLRETTLKDAADEYRMRVRVSLRAYWALWDMRQLLGGHLNISFSWQLWSHKVLRYLCFLFFGTALLSNLMLLDAGAIYRVLLLGQLSVYAAALLRPWLARQGRHHWLLNFSHYFLLLNLASAHAFMKFVSGNKQVLWTPRKG